MDFDIGEVLAVGLVFQFEVFGGDIADLAPICDDIDFKCVLLVGEISFGNVDRDTAEALFNDLVMDSTGVYGYRSFALGIRECPEHECRNIGEDDATKSIGQ